MSPSSESKEGILIIELHMMNEYKYYPLTLVSGFTVRSLLHPFSLIKTRLQIQRHRALYSGTFDAFQKILKVEGFRGLYKGFWVNNLQIIPSLAYISTYEKCRQYLANSSYPFFHSNRVKSFVGGACASTVGQTFMVPIDIVSQHLMMYKGVKHHNSSLKRLDINPEKLQKKVTAPYVIAAAVYQKDGYLGFYKGYFVSLATYAPNSALWWFFYDIYSNILFSYSPESVPRLLLQCFAAPLGGVTSSLMTNPMDVVRARMQVDSTSFCYTVQSLWKEEKLNIFTKGLTARITQSIVFSIFIMAGYETIKRISLLDEYKHAVRW